MPYATTIEDTPAFFHDTPPPSTQTAPRAGLRPSEHQRPHWERGRMGEEITSGA
jgi:hypothetical protein